MVLADDPFIQQLNHEYRGKNAPTNVLSFPGESFIAGDYTILGQRREPVILGDVILSLDTLKREALAADKPLIDHLTHLLVHGILHLLGYDHETDEEAALMEQKEIEILCGVGIDSPYEAC